MARLIIVFLIAARSSVPPTPDVDDMQRELREVLTLFKEKKRNIEFVKTPEVYINKHLLRMRFKIGLNKKDFLKMYRKV